MPETATKSTNERGGKPGDGKGRGNRRRAATTTTTNSTEDQGGPSDQKPQRGGKGSYGRRKSSGGAAESSKGHGRRHSTGGPKSGSDRNEGRPPFLASDTSAGVQRINALLADRRKPVATPATSNFRPRQRDDTQLSADEMLAFLESGLDQIRTSPVSRDAFIKSLATERGLRTVRQVAETEFSTTYKVLQPTFYPHCTTFLSIVSDEDILNSLILEAAVGTIYNVIYGPSGRRGIQFFKRAVACLAQLNPSDEVRALTLRDEEYLAIVHAATKALLTTLTMNQGSSVQKEFQEITTDLCACLPEYSSDRRYGSAKENISVIKDILSMGNTIPLSQEDGAVRSDGRKPGERKSAPAVRAPVDFPGELSSYGPRHDNDHAEIPDISILPSISEVLSQRQEYLPSRDLPDERKESTEALPIHKTGLLRLFDSQFRLLREDTSGLVRDSVRLILDNWEMLAFEEGNWKAKRKLLRDHSATPVRVYTGAEIQQLHSNNRWGLELEVQFDQLPRLRKATRGKREHWWRTSRELRENGPVTALLSWDLEGDIDLLFLIVSKRELAGSEPRDQGQKKDDESSTTTPKKCFGLANDPNRAMITLRLANRACEKSHSALLRIASRDEHAPYAPVLLVEFPAILFRNFEGVLRCLQALYKNPASLPFSRYLVERDESEPKLERIMDVLLQRELILVPSPKYLGEHTLDLSCLLTAVKPDDGSTNSGNNVELPPFSMSQDPHTLATTLAEDTSLDHGQAVALVSALRREIALIQGPPGTGKSFVGLQIARCLLANRHLFNLGPIVCICYTNHALDQFLQELLSFGVKDIIRIGGRSLSPTMEALSFDNYKKTHPAPRVKDIGRTINQCKAALSVAEIQIAGVCERLSGGTGRAIGSYLQTRFPEYHRVIFQGSVGSEMDPIETWLSGNGPGSLYAGNGEERELEDLLTSNLWSLTNSERKVVYGHWQQSAIGDLRRELSGLMQRFAATKHTQTEAHHITDVQTLAKAQVLGVATTQFANNIDLLRGLKAKVIICEEAAEVLESHVLTALLPSAQHLILIGDHLQLRPKISNLMLSKERGRPGEQYNLDESLFERLANSNLTSAGMTEQRGDGEGSASPDRFPISRLDHQRRMDPSISTLIRDTLYPQLKDHPDVCNYPEVPGIKRRLFWLDHRNFEDVTDLDEPMQSKSNTWEANMVTALVRHLCRQGSYKPGEIAVLTPYLSQLRMMTELMSEVVELVINEKDLEDLYDSDKELDAVVNKNNNSAKNRERKQKVEKGRLLDRVRMATIDNFQGEEATVIIISLVRSNAKRNCGFLKSPNRINVLLSRAKHGMYIVGDASTSAHVPMWQTVIEILERSGNIGRRLELKCSRHPENAVSVKDPEDFAVHSPEGGCDAKCKLRLNCGHSCSFKCHSRVLHDMVRCMERCTKTLDCGHACSKKCDEACGECRETVSEVMLSCGHVAKHVPCYQARDVEGIQCQQVVKERLPDCGHDVVVHCGTDISKVECRRLCEAPLACGHGCRRSCSGCRKARVKDEGGGHGRCQAVCGRNYTMCSHTCQQTCHPDSDCPPCQRPCEVRCQHSRCPKKCSEPCPQCAESCGWSCEHRGTSCQLPCAVPCNIAPCSKRCGKKLKGCGHSCPGVCGEKCPSSDFCQKCGKPEILIRVVDFILFETYQDVDADEDPFIFLSCGHFYTISNLDKIMELEESYKPRRRVATTGSPMKACPQCRLPLRDIHRYNRVVKTELLDEATRRFVATASSESAELLNQVQQLQENLEAERGKFIQQWSRGLAESKRVDAIEEAVRSYESLGHRLLRDLKLYTQFVSKTEQPFGRVNDLLANAKAKYGDGEDMKFAAFDNSMIQTGFQFRADCLTLRARWLLLWNMDTIACHPRLDIRMEVHLRESIEKHIKPNSKKCVSLYEPALKAKLPQYAVEARIFHALFSMLRLSNTIAKGNKVDAAEQASIRESEQESLIACEDLISEYPGTLAHLREEIDKAKILVNGGTFYTLVTTEERRNVYQAMAASFSGTGHWYYCENNHPFTVGECGMPMERAMCPECGAPVGGEDHQSVAGVRNADELELQFGRE